MRLNFPCFKMMLLIKSSWQGWGICQKPGLQRLQASAELGEGFPSFSPPVILFWSVFSMHGRSELRSMEYLALSSPCTDRMEAWHSREVSCAWLISDLPLGFPAYFCSLSYLLLFISCIFSCSFCSPDGSPDFPLPVYFSFVTLYLFALVPYFSVTCSSLACNQSKL